MDSTPHPTQADARQDTVVKTLEEALSRLGQEGTASASDRHTEMATSDAQQLADLRQTQHGLYCVGCCWVLMALLFVGGVMNVLWIAGLAVLVLLEKVVPIGRLVPRLAGAALTVVGLFFLVRS